MAQEAPEVQELPQQHYFVSNKDMFLASTLGHSLTFKKGKATHVPKALHSLAMEKGLLPCDKSGKELDLAGARDVVQQEPEQLVEPTDAEDRAEAILDVLKKIVARNNTRDFGGNNRPTVSAVTLALGWQTDAKEINKVWDANRETLLKRD